MRRFLTVFLLCMTAMILAVSCDQEIHKHTWDGGVVTARPSCVSIGAKTFTCTVCGETRVEVLDKTEHTPGEARTKDPTCRDEGHIETVCTVCGKKLSDTVIPAAGHVWDDGVVSEPATCKSIGAAVYTCTVCGETETRVIPKTDHVKGDAEVVPATCETAGYTRAVCVNCGDEYITDEVPPLDHSFSKTSVITQPTCEVQGSELWTCGTCGKTETRASEALGHAFGSPIETIPSTCIEHGSQFSHCSRCDQALWHELPLTEHTWDAGEITVFPTCTALGTKTYTCTYCGATKTEDVPMIDHSYVYDRTTVEATCVSTGTDVYACLVCGQEETRPTQVNPFNHSATAWVSTSEPKLFSEGSEKEVCDACGSETGEVRDVPCLSRIGWWTSSSVESDVGLGQPITLSYMLNFTSENHAVLEMFFSSEDLGGSFIDLYFDDDIVMLEGAANPDPENWLCAIQTKGSYDAEDDFGIYGVTADDGTGFTLLLDDGNGIKIPFAFTRESASVHVHTTAGDAIPFDDGIHATVTSCTEHDEAYLLENCEYEGDFCSICGQERSWEICLEDGDGRDFVWATKSEGYTLGTPLHGNAWEIPGQGIYYTAGEIYYPSGDGDYLRSCNI